MTKHVTVKEGVSPAAVGCSQQYFDRFIKGRQLKVRQEYKEIVLVQDANEEEFTICKEDLEKEKEVVYAKLQS